MVNLSKTHPRTVTIEGYPIQVRIARLTYEQGAAVRRQLASIYRTGKSHKQELERAGELSVDQMVALKDRHDAEDDQTNTYVRATIEAYVSVDPDQLQVDGRAVLTGKDLVDLFDEPALMVNLISLIEAGSHVSVSTGKASGSPSDSTRSSDVSDASGPALDGPRPEGTATDAAPAAMTETGDVTVATDRPSSGSMATSN